MGKIRIEQLSAITREITGLTISNNSGDVDHDIDVGVGAIYDSTSTFIIANNTTGFTKQIDAVWASGDGNGGRASAVNLTADTWYHYFVISKADGTFDAGFDTSISATNLLADATDFIYYKRKSSVRTDASSNIMRFTNIGKWMYCNTRLDDLLTTTWTTNTQTTFQLLSAPIDVIVNVQLNYGKQSDATNAGSPYTVEPMFVNDYSVDTEVGYARAEFGTLVPAAATLYDSSLIDIMPTNTLAQVWYKILRASDASSKFFIRVIGWEEL